MGRASVVAMIPARLGSERLAMKNLALVNGHPLLAWAIRAARGAGVFERVVVNGDHPAFGEVAERYGAGFYLRRGALGSSESRSDDVVLDFLRHHPAEVVAWVNPIAPLQTAREVREAVDHFLARGLDSLISVEERRVHCLLGSEPVNFRRDEKFARTQDLEPVQAFVYSLMMWRTRTFQAAMEQRGHAFFCGRFEPWPVERGSALIVKTEADLRLADALLRAREAGSFALRYDAAAPARRAPGGAASAARSPSDRSSILR